MRIAVQADLVLGWRVRAIAATQFSSLPFARFEVGRLSYATVIRPVAGWLQQPCTAEEERGMVQKQSEDRSLAFEELRPDKGPVPDRSPQDSEIVGRKGSIFYRSHSYHTKVPPEGIAEAIEHFTEPGAIVVDPFGGSGMTGVACLLTGRRGIVSDLSPAAVHIARNYVADVEPAHFAAAGEDLLRSMGSLERNLYGATCSNCHDRGARIEYTIWSDVYACPSCEADLLFWEVGLEEDRSGVRPLLCCAECGNEWRKRDLKWLRSVPVAVSVACPTCKSREQRPVLDAERALALGIKGDSISHWYPTDPFEDSREMWRGQHGVQGYESAADFFTPRNLWALSSLWNGIASSESSEIEEALRFVFTAIVNRASRRYQWNPRGPTNVLSSTMYVASVSYEFNVFSLFRRKLKTIGGLYEATTVLPGRAEAHLRPAQDLAHIPDRSVDYVFTDPPFGSNIFYGDSSFLWEAWLQDKTDLRFETVVNRSVSKADGGKSISDYERLMTEAFREIARILRPGAWASVMFHNSDDAIWSALQRAIESSGFRVGSAVAFDKSQSSFKGIKAAVSGERVPAFDLVLHLRQGDQVPVSPGDRSEAERRVLARIRGHLEQAHVSKRSTPYLHSLALRELLEGGYPLDGWSYAAIENLCHANLRWDGAVWQNPNGQEQNACVDDA